MIDIGNARAAVAGFQELLDATSPGEAHVRVSPESWTLAEIVGHLIDSACNNHQRFARLRLGNLDGFPGYDAEPWVSAQAYDTCGFETLSGLWSRYNALLLHLAATTPGEALANVWIRESGPLTLEFLTNDYYRHLRDHTGHYARRMAEVRGLAGRG